MVKKWVFVERRISQEGGKRGVYNREIDRKGHICMRGGGGRGRGFKKKV